MDEPEVVKITRDLFQSYGFKMKGQPDEGDVVLNGGDIRVDLQGFKESIPPELVWIECKGDSVPLKELLSDFVSLLLILNEYGGQGIFVCPSESYEKIIQYKEFMDKLQKNISKGEVKIVNVEDVISNLSMK